MDMLISLQRRRDAVARLLKIHLRDYPEHVIAQAIREAWRVLTAEPGSAHRAIAAGERHAQVRMEGTAIQSRERHDSLPEELLS